MRQALGHQRPARPGPGLGRLLLAARLLPLVACAHATPEPPPTSPAASPEPAPRPPLARSSIGAVLAHRNELALTDEQVAKLEELDRQAQAANEATRTERKVAGKPNPPAMRQPARLPPSEDRPTRDPTAGNGTGGRGMGRMGGRHRGPTGGSAGNRCRADRIPKVRWTTTTPKPTSTQSRF